MTRRAGRPSRGEGDAFRAEEVEAIYKHGILVEENGQRVRRYPGPTEIARIVGVSPSTISRFAKEHGLDKLHAERRAALKQSGASSRRAVTRRPGRPRQEDAPNVDWKRVEDDFVNGVLESGSGNTPKRVFPTQRELAEREGVSEATMSAFLTSRGAQVRRDQAMAAVPTMPELNDESAANWAIASLQRINRNLIKGGVAVSEQWVAHVEAGEVRSHDPFAVDKATSMAIEAAERETAVVDVGEVLKIPVALLEHIRTRRLVERSQQPFDPLLSGEVIDVHEAPVTAEKAAIPAENDAAGGAGASSPDNGSD